MQRRIWMAAAAVVAFGVSVQAAETESVWTPVSLESLGAASRTLVTNRVGTAHLSAVRLDEILGEAPLERSAGAGEVVLDLPMPDGGFQRFQIWQSPVLEPALAAQFPEIRTYGGRGLDDATATLRFDLTPAGFHAQVLSASGTTYIDPYADSDTGDYISYDAAAYRRADGAPEHRCLLTEDDVEPPSPRRGQASTTYSRSHGTQLRTYRLALAATGEYTAAAGGTVPLALARMTTTMNRVNGIFERELAVRMVLVANESAIIYTSGATDPYSNNNGSAMLCENQGNLNAVIGAGNYDIGHVFSTGGGGVATTQAPCDNVISVLGCPNVGLKARGVTGLPNPVGDGFDVDFVAHEMGHQFGALHSFNGTSAGCGGGNRSQVAAYEPGSGSTIMAYAGLCAPENLQSNSNDYFHARSLQEIIDFVTGVGGRNGDVCAAKTGTGNTPPVVSAGADFSVPMNTPFTLTASGSDPNGDALTYVWEEYDAPGTHAAPPNTDDGFRPIFRSFAGTTSPARTLPRLSDILNNTSTFGESLPVTTRNMTFRVTARDGRAGGGGTSDDDMVVAVTSTAGPFLVTSPNAAVTYAGNSLQTVTWNVANTTAPPVSCPNVRISFSTNGGNTFPSVLAASTPNDGSETVSIPNVSTTQARIKVDCVTGIFFDVSNASFTVNAVPVNLSIGSSSGREGDSGFTLMGLTVSLSTTAPVDVTVNYATAPGSATAGVDYTTSSGTVTIPAGSLSRTFVVPVVGDTAVEPDETFTVTLSGASGGATIVGPPATATILNDDPAAAAVATNVYRLYHDGTKEHLYTTDVVEYNALPAFSWIPEGIAYRMFTAAGGTYNGAGLVPFFRLYSPSLAQHHWTTDYYEALVLSQGTWLYEGVVGSMSPTSQPGLTPLYRLYLPSPPIHLWTTGIVEYNALPPSGWIQEGIVGYVLP